MIIRIIIGKKMELKEILEDFYNNRNIYEYPLYQSSKFIGANFESIVRYIDTNLINQSLRDEFLLEAETVDNQITYSNGDEYDLIVAKDFFEIIKKIIDSIDNED